MCLSGVPSGGMGPVCIQSELHTCSFVCVCGGGEDIVLLPGNHVAECVGGGYVSSHAACSAEAYC